MVKQTLKNLMKMFIGESMARNRYTIYAKVAKEEGYEDIAKIFLETADNEAVHARVVYELFNELKKESGETLDEVTVTVSAPTVLGDTVTNLEAAAAGEEYEYMTMYPEIADVAEKEGFKKVASKVRGIMRAEEYHAKRYMSLLNEIKKK
ncbi:MAG: rubrerythrin family protein [Candidatus Asgardarchaeia archaeon]